MLNDSELMRHNGLARARIMFAVDHIRHELKSPAQCNSTRNEIQDIWLLEKRSGAAAMTCVCQNLSSAQ